MPLIELYGSPRERGHIHGEALKNNIATVIDSWLSHLGSYGQQGQTARALDTTAYLDAFFSKTNYLQAVEHWAPQLLEEIRGIAEGSGQTFKHILGLNLMDEEWVFGLRHYLDKQRDKCTAFAVPNQRNGVSYAGQNMDIGSWAEGHQVLLRLMPSGNVPEGLVFSIAGSLGLNGLNARGLGVTCNTISQLQFATDGLPVGFVMRSILEQQSLSEAEDFVRKIKHASGQNFILSTVDEMRCFECCGSSVVRYAPDHLQGRVLHTNHPLTNPDVSDIAALNTRTTNTVARLDSITMRLGDSNKILSLDDIKMALAAHDDPDNPVSRNTNKDGSSIGYTAGASIYELGERPRLYLAAGPPCETKFEIFDFLSINNR